MDETIYSVTIYFKDKNGGEHEKTVQCKGFDEASQLVLMSHMILAKMRKSKLITTNVVSCNPPLPR